MESAIRIGVTNDYILKSLKNQQLAIKELITERWREYLPSIGVSIGRTRTINDAAEDTISHQIRFNVEQVIYDGGRRELDVDLAKLDALLNRHDAIVTYNQLQLRIRTAYLRALAAQGKIHLNEKSLVRARLQLRHTRLEKRLGFVTDAQVYLVAARVREIELALQRSRNEYTNAIHDLRLVLNLDYGTELVLTETLFRDYILYPPEADLEELVFRARSQRPEIRRSMAQLHRARKELEMVENEWIPRVSIGGYVGRSGERYPLRERDWGVNFSITFPLGSTTSDSNSAFDSGNAGNSRTGSSNSGLSFFDDLGHDRRLMESKVSLAETTSEHEQLMNELAIEISRNYENLHENWEAIRIGNGQVFFQFTSLRILKTRYQVGEVRRADIVEAERDLVQAQQDLTDAIVEYIISVYELEFASASSDGSLNLIKYDEGRGNTLLLYLLNEDFGGLETEGQRSIDTEEARDYLEDRTGETRNTDEEFLIDEVKLD